jgi:alpha-L-arabinofuranosidase
MPTLRIFPADASASIDPRLYGSFVEHLGRCVYTGIYEPGHPTADAEGWRTDVLALVRELRVPIVRYPGGNFVSAYDWEDGVGPRDKRPRRLDFAWGVTETNQVGTDEFIRWCKLVGAAPMMAVNLGTRGVDSARQLLEYCNHPGGSKFSDLRRANGHAEPHNVRVWCLGNEMDGPWQTGHKTAAEYGRLAAETARAMRQYDDSLELVACGSSSPGMATFMEWEREVLEHTYPLVDAISLHLYLGRYKNSLQDYLAEAVVLERQIHDVIVACDYVKACHRHKKTMMLSFDEWNVWDQQIAPPIPKDHKRWSCAPHQLEQIYTLADALVFGGMMIALIRNAARVRMACVAQLVNVIAPILTREGGGVWRQPIFWPYLHGSLHGRGNVVASILKDAPTHATERNGKVAEVDAVATRDGDHLTVFVLNRGLNEVQLPIALDGTSRWAVVEHSVLTGTDETATNTEAEPDRVRPRAETSTRVAADNTLTLRLPAMSWHCLRLKAAATG